MAHPHQGHREHSKSRSRAGHVLKSGGDVHPHAAKDKGSLSAAFRRHEGHPQAETTVSGYARGGRIAKYARGGKADKKHHTQVNIAVVAPHRGEAGGGAGAAPGGPGAAPMPPHPPMGGPPGMPPGLPPGMAGGPPGMPPGMPPPGMGPRPPMARGGAAVSQMKPLSQSHPAKRNKIDGMEHPAHVGNRSAVKPGGGLRNKYASGGPTKPVAFDGHTAQKGGGDSGIGRRNKPKMYGGSKPHPKI